MIKYTLIVLFFIFSSIDIIISLENKNNSVCLSNSKNEMSHTTSHHCIESLPNSHADLGEGPHWDIETQSLYFVGLTEAKLFRYDFNENKTYQAKIGNETFSSFIIPIQNAQNEFAVGLDRKIGRVKWDGRSSTAEVISTIVEVENGNEKYTMNRFNDAKADPFGRFYGGTMHMDTTLGIRSGNFYRFEKGITEAKLLKDDVGISNGLAWNLERKKFYYIDSFDANVKEYDYNEKSGEIENPTILIDFNPKDGGKPDFVPDGMTIDSKGMLYVATWGGSKVLQINSINGKIEHEIKMPCEQVTSAAFGGPNLDILFVTTASAGGKTGSAGLTFKITGLGNKGLMMHKLNL